MPSRENASKRRYAPASRGKLVLPENDTQSEVSAPAQPLSPQTFRQGEAAARPLLQAPHAPSPSKAPKDRRAKRGAKEEAIGASYQGELTEASNVRDDTSDPGNHMLQNGSLEGPTPPPNAGQTMLHLMRTTRGRMKGHVYVRRRSSYPWQQIYCVIGKNGALRSEQEDEDALLATLMRDLRGCKVYASVDSVSRETILRIHVRAAAGVDVLDLKPHNEKDFNYWHAALLCWQPVTAKLELHQKIERPLSRQLTALGRDHIFVDRNQATIYSHPAILIEQSGKDLCQSQNVFVTDQTRNLVAGRERDATAQAKVLCSLYGDGKLVLQRQSVDHPIIATIMLGGLPRSAIQRLDRRVFGQAHVIGIYPQYALSSDACSRLRPIFLTYDSIELYQAWFALLRVFAVPEMYFLQPSHRSSSYAASLASPAFYLSSLSAYLRTEQSLSVTINGVKFRFPGDTGDDMPNSKTNLGASNVHYYAEVLVDEQIKARTTTTSGVTLPHWYERYALQDLSNSTSTLSVRVIKVFSEKSDQKFSTHPELPISALGVSNVDAQSTPAPREQFSGQVDIKTDELDEGVESNQWWPLTGDSGSVVGEIALRVELSQERILAGKAYDQILRLLRETSNGLTLKIWRHVPGQLAELAEYFLNIFQASGGAIEWLEYLAEEEINNGTRQAENSPTKLRGDDPPSADANELSTTPETQNDKRKTAIAETSILFRANTLLTKALDLFIKRVGGVYLEVTIGAKVREIQAIDDICEVDPTKLPEASEDDLEKNWRRLLKLTEEVWELIYQSASTCPSEIKVILQHIRVCANKQFGNIIPTVVYSSVSGFVFLRFFCAAIMNPHLFGLIDARPSPRTLRTYLLVAKAIQGLANMTTFGAKESWMAPMNTFYSAHRQELMDFIDSICVVSRANVGDLETHRRSAFTASPLYDAPLAIDKRLPPVSREGSLSLPHLIDRPRNLAALVDLWMNNFDRGALRHSLSETRSLRQDKTTVTSESPHTLTLTTLKSILDDGDDDEDLAKFHEICHSLRQRTAALVEQSVIDSSFAEDANGRNEEEDVALGDSAQKWVKISERIEMAPDEYWVRDIPPVPPPESLAVSSPIDIQGSRQEQNIDPKSKRAPESIDTASRTSGDSKRRSRLSGGVGAGAVDLKSKRKDSTSNGSGRGKSPSSNESSSKGRKKKLPSPPARDAEENALRKLGWI